VAVPRSIDRAAGDFEIDGGSTRYPATNARVLVLYWLPGENAAAVE
jgi:hypothetical protein